MNWESIRKNWPIILFVVGIVATNARGELQLDQHGTRLDSIEKRDAATAELKTEIAVLNAQRESDKQTLDDIKAQQQTIINLLLQQ